VIRSLLCEPSLQHRGSRVGWRRLRGSVERRLGEIELTGFNPASSVIVADLAALLSDSDINSNQVNTAPGCQSDPDDLDCVPMFKNLGINFSDGSPNPTSQKFFRLE